MHRKDQNAAARMTGKEDGTLAALSCAHDSSTCSGDAAASQGLIRPYLPQGELHSSERILFGIN